MGRRTYRQRGGPTIRDSLPEGEKGDERVTGPVGTVGSPFLPQTT